MKSLCIIIPCLNEQDSISFCLEKIKSVLEKEHIEKTEVIVVDNKGQTQGYINEQQIKNNYV